MDKWSQEVCKVVKQPNSNIPVYEVTPVTVSWITRVLQCNLLLPIPCLPPESQTMPQPKPRQRVSQSAVDQADDAIHFLTGDKDCEQLNDHSKEEIFVNKPRTVLPVTTPRRTLGLLVTLKIDESGSV